ncbi:BA14K family protein [Brevundimonas sp.]|uniref:BA14K family protein n=1 Tax=Brevundimonas sp. TaxID=1871086 RepID=UPI0025D66D3D|nr:BA14K family protein [Brevundimonas sp.]
MRRLITTLAAGAAFIGLAAPASAGTSATTAASSSVIATQYRGDCYRGESFSECRRRIEQQQNRDDYERYYRYDPYRYGYDNRYQYNPYDYGQYGYNRYGQYDYNRYGYDYGRHYNNYGNGYGYGSTYGYGNGYGVDAGTALALTILGSALGVNIVGTTDDRDYYNRYRYDDSWRRWCQSRYRSFDWRSGTYLHNDGYRRYCRMY